MIYGIIKQKKIFTNHRENLRLKCLKLVCKYPCSYISDPDSLFSRLLIAEDFFNYAKNGELPPHGVVISSKDTPHDDIAVSD